MILTIIIFLITLLILVVSHEFGHFITAKKFGVKVLEFGFGLPPKIFGKKIGETIYSLNLLPVGGFVRLFGEDETEEKNLKHERSFAAKKVWQRIIIVTAGVWANLLLAMIIFWIVLGFQGFKENIPLLIPFKFAGVNQTNEAVIVVGKVAESSPASLAGINPGDRISEFDGQKLENGEQLFTLTKEKSGAKVTLTLINPEEEKRQVEVTPRKAPPEGQGPLGVELGSVTVAHLNYQTTSQKIFSGPVHSYNLASYSINVLGKFISQAFEQKSIEPVSGTISGPVGITNVAGMILQTKSPIIPYLNFVGLLSLNLAIINILPFPALDGGRLFFLAIEAVFRKKVKAEVEKWVHTIGMVILIALIILVTLSDIKKFF